MESAQMSPEAPRRGAPRIAPYAISIFTGALLLFLVQPMIAKQLLPRFGGAAAVWTACLMFFQLVLLAGYLYADWTARTLRYRTQGILHAALIASGAAVAWISPSGPAANVSFHPVVGVLGVLTVTVGLPYFVLSATSPLLQSWYASAENRPVPYRLYALSNLASLIALLAYPLAVEPALDLAGQMRIWRIAYLIFALFTVMTAIRTASIGRERPPVSAVRQSIGVRPLLLWITLAACPSILLLAVTNELSQDIAPVPLLWIAPLAVYLITFILCFNYGPVFNLRMYQILVPAALAGLIWAQAHSGKSIGVAIALCVGGLFVIAMFCHSLLAERKPEGSGATAFYLAISVGGAAGGLFVGLLAPQLFSNFFELPVGCALALALSLYFLFGYRTTWFPPLCSAVGLIFLQLLWWFAPVAGKPLFVGRNFYGILAVGDTQNARRLVHGMTIHGTEILPYRAGITSREPTAYYGRQSGAGVALARSSSPQRVGAVGLGAGTIAAYGRPGDVYRFYEINPLVIEVARNQFHFLRESGARIEIVLGDARLSLESEPDQQFDVLILDAFSGDSVPVHLLTREAFQLYFRHLRPQGILAVHISNRYLDLAPVVLGLAGIHKERALRVHSPGDPKGAIIPADWVLVSQDAAFFQEMVNRGKGQLEMGGMTRPWTDQFSNILSALRR